MTDPTPGVYEKAIGEFNADERLSGGIIPRNASEIWLQPGERFYRPAWFKSGKPDRLERPNAWPRFSIWPPFERSLSTWWGLYWLAAVILGAPIASMAGPAAGLAWFAALWVGFSLGRRWPFRLRRGGRQ